MNNLKKIFIFTLILSLLTGCYRSGSKLNREHLASIDFEPESGEVLLTLNELDYLKQSFVDELEEYDGIEIQITTTKIYIYFDTLENFNIWSIKYFDGKLIKYTNIDTILLKYENIKFNDKLFYENKYNIYEKTPEEERVIKPFECSKLDVLVLQCQDYETYVYVLEHQIVTEDSLASGLSDKYDYSIKEFPIVLIDENDELDEVLEENLTKYSSYKYLKIEWITYLVLLLLIGIGSFFLYQYLSKKLEKSDKSKKEI